MLEAEQRRKQDEEAKQRQIQQAVSYTQCHSVLNVLFAVTFNHASDYRAFGVNDDDDDDHNNNNNNNNNIEICNAHSVCQLQNRRCKHQAVTDGIWHG